MPNTRMPNARYSRDSVAPALPRPAYRPRERENVVELPRRSDDLARRARERRQAKAHARSQTRRAVLIRRAAITLYIAAVLAATLFMRVMINVSAIQIGQAQSKIAQLQAEQAQLQLEAESKVSFSTLETTAAALGMVHADKSQVKYIQLPPAGSAPTDGDKSAQAGGVNNAP